MSYSALNCGVTQKGLIVGALANLNKAQEVIKIAQEYIFKDPEFSWSAIHEAKQYVDAAEYLMNPCPSTTPP